MSAFTIFTDIHGRRWICGKALQILFGISETGKPRFWDYDELCEWQNNLDVKAMRGGSKNKLQKEGYNLRKG